MLWQLALPDILLFKDYSLKFMLDLLRLLSESGLSFKLIEECVTYMPFLFTTLFVWNPCYVLVLGY